ncbi:MAG: S8 family serine peptidase [Candidatus Cloacimonetes bacterium]|nr:S8 family serine peptidase [Candidatus Cloacimonadota bacterium]
MQRLLIMVLLLTSVVCLSAVEPFIHGSFHENILIFCFSSETVGTSLQPVAYEIEAGVVETGISEFDNFSKQFEVTELKQLHPFVKYSDWNDKGIYLQNIYSLTIADNKKIESALENLRKLSVVLFAEYEGINRTREFIPDDPQFSMLYYITRTQTHLAWDWVQGDSDVIIGITDTGVKWNHEDLRDNIWINQAEYQDGMINWDTGVITAGDGVDNDGNGKIDDVIGWDFTGASGGSSDNNPYQIRTGNEHGTHVSGCAGAVGNNGIGVVGPAMNISLMITKNTPDNSVGGISNGYPAIQYCADSGAHVINCSWGGPGSGTYPNSVVNYATNAGALVVSAAGNEDTEHNAAYQDYPADCTNALGVAATDQNDIKTYFSDYGTPVDISAPGIDIRSTYFVNYQDSYSSLQGTSMASPIAAGVCALVKSISPNLTPVQLRERVKNTADNIDNLNPDYAGKLGTGRINAYTATMSDKIPNLRIVDFLISELDGDGDEVPNPGETVDLSIMLENQLFWLNATNITATLSCELETVEMIDASTSFYDLDGGSSMWNFSDPLSFSTVPDLSNLDIPFVLTVSCNQDNEFPYTIELPFIVSLSLDQAGWPFEISGASNSSGLIIDLDEDGNKEAVFGDHLGNLNAIDAAGQQIAGFPVALGSEVKSAVAIANISGGPELEIVAGTNQGRLVAVSHTGVILWDNQCTGQISSNPVIYDINNDGNQEVIVVTFSGQLNVFTADGNNFEGYPYSFGSNIVCSPAVADMNGDGLSELMVSTAGANSSLVAITLATQTNIDGWPVNIGTTSWKGPIVTDIDGNGNPEVVVATFNSSVKAFTATGSLIYETTQGGGAKTSIASADLNSNEENEVVFIDNAGNLQVLNAQGENLAGFPFAVGATSESTPVLIDMDNDEMVDIVFGDNNGYLHSVSLMGYETPNFPLFLGTSIKISPAIGDIDGDGDIEILVPNQSSYVLLDYKNPVGAIPWPCDKATPARTANYYDITDTDDDNSNPDLPKNSLDANYPNPFNPSTKIRFSISEPGNVSLTVYNIKGQLVKTLRNDYHKPGSHIVEWNGKDNHGNDTASGLYFYKLSTKTFTDIKKMILIK